MMQDPDRRQWFRTPTDLPRQRRQWDAIARSLDARASLAARLGLAGPSRWALAAAVGVALAVGVGAWRRREAPAPVAAAAAGDRRLADGSVVSPEAGCELTVPAGPGARAEATLTRGAARFAAAPGRSRGLRVVAGEVEVEGTAFRVALEPISGQVIVSVEHGMAEVRSALRPGEVQRLEAGQSWSSQGGPAAGAASAASAAGAGPAGSAAEAAGVGPGGEGASGEGAGGGAAGGVVYGSSGHAGRTAPRPAAPSSSREGPGDEGARALFESASQARRAGDVRRAAGLYRELVRRYPNDARAQVAALEIGRLEMDGKGDLGAAEGALKAASSAGAGGAVHEDSLARLVELYASRGDAAACRQARDRYLAAYPNGVHVNRVRGACPAP